MSTTATAPSVPPRPAARGRDAAQALLMLLLAFEILVLGFAQSMFQPVRQTGITIEMSVTPNHVVT